MKVSGTIKRILPFFLVLAFVGALAVPTSVAASKTYKMKGKITAIDLEYNTVVVDVPIGKKKVYTVAGPLVQDAILKKGNKAATLKDFQKGESVVVEWTVTDKGHIVKLLVAE